MTGLAGEIGHIQVDPLGAICSCGNRGCLNTIVAENRLVQLLSVTHGNMTMDDLVAQANNGDPGCRRIIADTAVRIGQVAADLCISIDPEVVVVGGKLAMAGEVFTQPFNEALQRLLFPDAVMPITVLSSLTRATTARWAARSPPSDMRFATASQHRRNTHEERVKERGMT